MPTMVNPYYWDQFQLRRRNLIPRRFDSMYGEKNMTIIQLDENVITDPFRHALYAYPRMYAREEHVVDWSGIKQEDLVQYFYGMALRYGMPQEWPEIDKFEMEHQWPVASGDRNVYRIGPPPAFRRPYEFRFEPPQTHYIFPSHGERPEFDHTPYDSIVTSGLPPIGYVTMWQEWEDVRAYHKVKTERELREKWEKMSPRSRKKKLREIRAKYEGIPPRKKRRNEDKLSSDDDDTDDDDTDDDDTDDEPANDMTQPKNS